MSYGAPTSPPPRRRRRTLLIVIVVVVILVIGVIAFASFESQSPAIQVGFINIWAPDNVCGLNTNPIAYYGFNSSTGASESLDFPVPNYNATACTIESVTTNSSGFSLSSVQVPLEIAGNGTGSMNMTIEVPTSSFSGDMNLVFS